MAATNYGRERPTPGHVRAHDNPVPTVVGGGLVDAALGQPSGGSPTGPGGLGGLKPLQPGVSVIGAFGRPRPKPLKGRKPAA